MYISWMTCLCPIVFGQDNDQLKQLLKTGSTKEAIAEIRNLNESKDGSLLIEALMHKEMAVRASAMYKLKNNPEKTFVHKMLDYLERNNFTQEGSEIAAVHVRLMQIAIAYIETATGRSMGIKNIDNLKEVSAAIASARSAK